MEDSGERAASAAPGGSPLRFITGTSLFDGHDAAINVMRRLIQARGVEVVHLGHNRSVADLVRAAIHEDADAIAVTSYQGGHNEYFRYMIDRLRECGAGHIRVFGGGGGTITQAEIAALHDYGVERIYHPLDGAKLGLSGMIDDVIERCRMQRRERRCPDAVHRDDPVSVAAMLSALDDGLVGESALGVLRGQWRAAAGLVPVIGVTGTGGSGKSSFTDELLSRFLQSFPGIRIAVLAVDPTRRRTGGALLGDRIRMNSLRSNDVFMRSIATRRQHLATSAMLGDSILLLKSLGFDLLLVETAGIGQSDSEIIDLVDVPLYVMTSEYGAASQLEKIDMLDFAELVVLNKSDKRGAEDALRDVRKQWRRNHADFSTPDSDLPVDATVASQFADPGVTTVFLRLCDLLEERFSGGNRGWRPAIEVRAREHAVTGLIPAGKSRYLAEIAAEGRAANAGSDRLSEIAGRTQHCYEALREIGDDSLPAPLQPFPPTATAGDATLQALRARYNAALADLGAEARDLLVAWPARLAGITGEEYRYTVRDHVVAGDNYQRSLSQQRIPRIAPPTFTGWADLLNFLLKENLPGAYPYTAGVYPYRRAGEDPIRMFAGEGTPERTNRRFHYLARGQAAVRLSTAFDSATLYGEDPHERPDIYGKVGNAGVSIATVDDAKKLYSGFDLCATTTSVSLTINGPAPTVLAFYINAAIDQQVEKHLRATGAWEAVRQRLGQLFADCGQPGYGGELPEGNTGLGLGLLGVSGEQVLAADTYQRIRADTLRSIRGTVQADILKEDQAQNTCIFSTEFAMKMMGDVQQYFSDHDVRNFYSVSISGYHIAEAGANPISQLAFTLSNGFTIVEYYLARGMHIDDFAPNLSFFFSNGMDPEYAVIGRVARRIWARAMRERYGASVRSQMLKYHVQTSGRSLHAQEISFNDIRTTLQALYALIDNCNSLHTNAYDEAVTTPTEQSVRRAVAIQLIINREFGLNFCENAWQGSFIISELTDLVEEAVYREFDHISERGGVLAAMDSMYQRGRIQDESMLYESRKHDGSLPLIGVNTFLPRSGRHEETAGLELMRSTAAEKQAQVAALRRFQSRHAEAAPAALQRLQRVASERGNVFGELLDTVKVASLGQITAALYGVGGEYRRNM